VVKAQIHAGGRGKGRFAEDSTPTPSAKRRPTGDPLAGKGGVQLARTLDDVGPIAESMLGKTLVTKQTGPRGQTRQDGLHRGRLRHRPRAVPGAAARPRRTAHRAVMASTEGGMEIEEVRA
jgi:succinyl-CoA synthetase beta subunit